MFPTHCGNCSLTVAVWTTYGISEVEVDLSFIWMHERDLNTKTFASTNASHNIINKCVLKSELDSTMCEYSTDIRATDDTPKVKFYMSSTWM